MRTERQRSQVQRLFASDFLPAGNQDGRLRYRGGGIVPLEWAEVRWRIQSQLLRSC